MTEPTNEELVKALQELKKVMGLKGGGVEEININSSRDGILKVINEAKTFIHPNDHYSNDTAYVLKYIHKFYIKP